MQISTDLISIFFLVFLELKALLQYVTGAPAVEGNSIIVSFCPIIASITANTCGRELQLSPNIQEEKRLFQELDVVVNESDFTMP